MQRMRWVKALTHLVILLIVFVAPELLFNLGHKEVHPLMYIGPVCYITMFYIDYYVLIDRYLFSENRKWVFYVVNVVMMAAVLCLLFYVHHFLIPHGLHGVPPAFLHKMPMPPAGGHFLPPPPLDEPIFSPEIMELVKFMPRVAVLAVMAIGLSVLLKFSEKWVKWDRMEKQMVAEQQTNELKNLKNQLNPHFLFNTLNNIYALIAISQEKAQLAVHELSQLLRYVLYDNNDVREVALEKDMQFVCNYIALMKLRLSQDVKLSVDINAKDGMGKTIAPLLFISLVENAFKHGVTANKDSFISISIKVIGTKVVCHVENSYFPKDSSDKSGSGIGIANLKRQLSILYPDRHTYSIKCTDDKYIADLEILLTEP
jgi:two-component sensor histidine kinase